MRRTIFTGTVLAAALALGGCSALGGSGAADEAGTPSQGGELPSQAGADDGGAVVERDQEDQAGQDLPDDRSVIVTGRVTVTVDDPLAAAQEAVDIVERSGGRVDGRTEHAPTETDSGRAQLELRIPADALTDTLEELRGLGRADEVALSSEDVTVERQDIEARISALRASIDRLQALIAEASDIGDLIALESELSDRQAELESLEAQQRYYADQVSMSTIVLHLRTEEQAPEVLPEDFGSGLAAGWEAFVAFWAGLLVVLGVLTPWLLLAAVIAGAVVLIVRRRLSRARRGTPAA